MKLTGNVRKTTGYSQGGAQANVIAWATFLANGVSLAATVELNAGKVSGITFAATEKPVVLECEKDKVAGTFPTQFGASTYVKQALGLVLAGADTAKNAAAKAMDLTDHCYVVKDRRGTPWLFGHQNGLRAAKNDGGLGGASGDLNGYDISVEGAENDRPLELTLEAYNALAQLVAAD
ncbi:hypothetical protein [uncultured Hymenobacter sp.]|uniref:hypothetical protein n=1 Tax=uncultured Hymenobacter sp. TaxID=170016 RepID=UPI0035C99A12